MQHIRNAFAFEYGGVNTPMETFGPVPGTIPPGLVFNYGAVPFPEGQITPIRFLHIEQSRVVIDVAGPSAAVGETFAMLNELFSDTVMPDGAPALGKPSGYLDYSEIRVHLRFEPKDLVAPALWAIYEGFAPTAESGISPAVVPSLQVHLHRPGEKYLGGNSLSIETFVLDIRAGTDPRDGIYFSGAPLDTDAHLAMLERIKSAIIGQPAELHLTP